MATLLFAGNILDRFLAAHCIDGAMELYKAINCSIYLAMKIEEIYPPVSFSHDLDDGRTHEEEW